MRSVCPAGGSRSATLFKTFIRFCSTSSLSSSSIPNTHSSSSSSSSLLSFDTNRVMALFQRLRTINSNINKDSHATYVSSVLDLAMRHDPTGNDLRETMRLLRQSQTLDPETTDMITKAAVARLKPQREPEGVATARSSPTIPIPDSQAVHNALLSPAAAAALYRTPSGAARMEKYAASSIGAMTDQMVENLFRMATRPEAGASWQHMLMLYNVCRSGRRSAAIRHCTLGFAISALCRQRQFVHAVLLAHQVCNVAPPTRLDIQKEKNLVEVVLHALVMLLSDSGRGGGALPPHVLADTLLLCARLLDSHGLRVSSNTVRYFTYLLPRIQLPKNDGVRLSNRNVEFAVAAQPPAPNSCEGICHSYMLARSKDATINNQWASACAVVGYFHGRDRNGTIPVTTRTMLNVYCAFEAGGDRFWLQALSALRFFEQRKVVPDVTAQMSLYGSLALTQDAPWPAALELVQYLCRVKTDIDPSFQPAPKLVFKILRFLVRHPTASWEAALGTVSIMHKRGIHIDDNEDYYLAMAHHFSRNVPRKTETNYSSMETLLSNASQNSNGWTAQSIAALYTMSLARGESWQEALRALVTFAPSKGVPDRLVNLILAAHYLSPRGGRCTESAARALDVYAPRSVLDYGVLTGMLEDSPESRIVLLEAVAIARPKDAKWIRI
eukprot:PhM_4_TR10590/c0_g1_i1/m.67615